MIDLDVDVRLDLVQEGSRNGEQSTDILKYLPDSHLLQMWCEIPFDVRMKRREQHHHVAITAVLTVEMTRELSGIAAPGRCEMEV